MTVEPSVSAIMLYCTGGPADERDWSKMNRIEPTLPRGTSWLGPAARTAVTGDAVDFFDL